MQIQVSPLIADDRSEWELLARGYKEFYQTPTLDSEYERAWNRLLNQDGVFVLGARGDDRLLGITHYLFHTSTWQPAVCYLQDLFVSPSARGLGIARALIEGVAEASRARGAQRLYWLTHDHNTTARALYDKVARYDGFIRYDYPI